MSATFDDDDHPLFFELKSTRAALTRCQEESHACIVKLQRDSLDNARSHERAVYLQRENDLLKAEIAILRATPGLSHESKAPIQELTLSLRKLSLKLTLTEEALLERTKALLNAQADVTKGQVVLNAANGLTAELQIREELERARTKDLALKIKKQEEELRMSNLVIGEYAELVRELEARSKTDDKANAEDIRSKGSTLDSALSHGRFDLQHAIKSFRSQYDEAYQELEKTRSELDIARSQLVANQQAELAVMEDFAKTKAELDSLKINDGTAAKMVARYMQFSQSSTNALLVSLEALKKRHTATLSTLSSQNQLLLTRIRSLESQNQQLRMSLDDLGGEVQREKYGRRREIGLRIRMGGREQRIAEGLRRWVRQSEEVVRRLEVGAQADEIECHPSNALLELSQDARILLDFLEQGGADEETAVSLSGSRARELMVHGGVDELLEELRIETEQRVMQQISGNGTGDEELESKSLKSFQQSRRNSSGSPLTLENQVPAMVVITPSDPEEEDCDVKSGSFLVEEVKPNLPSPQRAAEDKANDSDHISRDDAREVAASSQLSRTTESPSDDQQSDSSNDPLVAQLIVNSSSDNPPSTPIVIHESDVSADSPDKLSEQHTSYSASPDTASVCHEEILPVSQQTLHKDVTSLSPSASNGSELCVQRQSEGPLSHPLLAELTEVKKRYDLFQREFRDCHLALEGLKATLVSGFQSSTEVNSLPVESLRLAVTRLDDFTEDVRVELEIRVGDEELLAKGYEALLRVSGALSSYSRSAGITGAEDTGDGSGTDIPFGTDIEREIKAFLDGTDPAVKRTRVMFTTKLEDVQHDVAVLKRAIHDPCSIVNEQSRASTSSPMGSTSVQKAEPGFDPAARLTGGIWSSWIRGPATPTSAFRSSPTFGAIMTSPKLPQASPQTEDLSTDEGSGGLGILGSFVGLGGKEAQPRNPLISLGLRVALPSFHADAYGINPMSTPFGSMVSPSYSSLGIGPAPVPKSRTPSMYMLGLGSFGGSGRVSRTSSNGSCVSLKAVNGEKLEADTNPGGTKDDEIE